jgi:predicted enzyme related to lactoylglutathione lyase
MSNPKGSFIWYELMSPDPAGSKAFYDAVVGWTIEEQPSGDIDYRMIDRRDGGIAGGVLTLTDEMRAGGAPPLWLGYVTVPDVDATLAAITADGGAVMIPARDQLGVGRMAMITGPEGAPIYLLDPIPPEGEDDAMSPNSGSDVFSVDQPEHIRWNELSSSDPARSIDFYKRHFGWAQEGAMDMGPMGQYQFIQAGGVAIGAIMPVMDKASGPRWTYYIGVDDIDRGTAAVTANGGSIVQPPIEIPGGEYSLVAVDPQGASFGLVGPRR